MVIISGSKWTVFNRIGFLVRKYVFCGKKEVFFGKKWLFFFDWVVSGKVLEKFRQIWVFSARIG